jgi:hypothetical protein
MENLSDEELIVIYEALRERSLVLDETSRKGISIKIRKVASEEYKETNAVWDKVGKLLSERQNKKH